MTTTDLASFAHLTDEQVYQRIRQAKQALGPRLAILGHHYQADDVIQFADYRGDSLGLSQRAASLPEAEYIVFCGVTFMAETAAMLCKPNQFVFQPEPEAFCPMAILADAEQAQEAWAALTGLWGDDLIPITYQNSNGDLKAFVGRHGGAVCTSSNADKLMRWALGQKGHLLFMPDEHLGTNTALALGIPLEQIGVWDPLNPPDPRTLAQARVVVWKGFCYVHAGMTPEDIDKARREHPGALVVVHPECPHEVVAKADATGSTTGIIDYVEQAPVGATIVVGTEFHLVNRLAHRYTDRKVVPLAARSCKTMGMTTARHLLRVVDNLLQARDAKDAVQRNAAYWVRVDDETACWARVALERMLEA
jgi:quinolinate synthase